ncbi:branched-chain amino acid ABC transporter substrate-binding protein [Rhizohabitans arisaemae]|uniref:branched-chain amino acid ABC transporter substrate-binding protein n=1 Tax=Rhizohabitans arisaemae TaxID=2720610 RepID=UPI0024B2209D|nr:branched-chain amino acid ABC transporter substrate-binding protein [Rhizohabitans arisaemae]
MALTLTLAACGGGDSTEPAASGGGDSPTTLKIGFMGDLTGENSAIVIPPRNGAKLAIDEYNAKNPKIKVELVPYDSQGNPDQAVPLAQQAITQDKIVALIGPAFSGESKNVGPILEQGKIPSISASATNPDLSKNGWKYWHRLVATDAAQGKAVADFLAKATSAKKAYVIDDKQEYSVGIADVAFETLKAAGATIERDKIDQDGSDYSSTVTKVKAFAPDLIFYGGYYAQAGRLLKQLRTGGVKAAFASGDGSLDQNLVSGAGADAAEGAVVGCPCFIPYGVTEGPVKTFADNYKKAYNADPAIYATEGYDAATAFLQAIEKGHTTGEAINTYLSTVDFTGVSKPVKFGPDGELGATTIHIYRVKGGQITWLGDSTVAKLD